MRLPIPKILRRLDRYLLVNHPILWMMHIHWVACFWMVGLALIIFLATVVPKLFIRKVLGWNYPPYAFVVAMLLISFWAYFQAHFTRQLQEVRRHSVGVYLLGGYLAIVSSFSAWLYAFMIIVRQRFSRLNFDEIALNYSFYMNDPFRLAIFLGEIIVIVVILLRVLQMGGARSILPTIVFGSAMLIAGVSSYPFLLREGLWTITVAVTTIIGSALVFQSRRTKRRSAVIATCLNLFTFFVLFVPGLVSLSDAWGYCLMCGIGLLFSLLPWIQRGYIVHQAKPE